MGRGSSTSMSAAVMRRLNDELHLHHIGKKLKGSLEKPENKIDLFGSALWISQLDELFVLLAEHQVESLQVNFATHFQRQPAAFDGLHASGNYRLLIGRPVDVIGSFNHKSNFFDRRRIDGLNVVPRSLAVAGANAMRFVPAVRSMKLPFRRLP